MSTLAVNELLGVLPLPPASVNASAPTESDIAVVELAVGVKVNEYRVPEPVKPLIVPPLTVMSPTTKSLEISLSVAVMVAV